MYTILIAITFIIVGVFCVKNVFKSDQKGRNIPGPRGLPLVGSVLQIKPEKIYEQFSEFAKQYGKIFKLQIFDTNVVVLNSVEMVNKAFVTEGHIFNERQYLFIADKIGLMKSVSFIYFNKEHNIARKAFVKSLHMYGTGIAKFENIVQGELQRLIQEIDSYEGEKFEVVWLIKRSIVNIISILLIGEKATDEHVKLFFELTSGEDFFLNAATNTILSNFPFLLNLPYYKRRMDKIIEAKRILQKKYVLDVKNGIVDKDKTGFVSGLFHCQQQGSGPESELTDDMVKAISITDVMTAGVLTTSATLLNAILCLINHPEYQARIQEEVDAVFGPDNKPSVNQRHECSFIEALILETMRYIPTTPFLLPHACKVNTELEGYAIKSNSQVLANLWYIHHDESIWGDPWTYRPERFLGDDGHILPNDHVYMKSFLTFGSGRRKCPGMSMATTRIFLYLATLLQNYTLLPSPGQCGTCDPRYGEFTFVISTFSFLTFGSGRRKCPGMSMATTRIFLYLATLLQNYKLVPSPGQCGTCDPRYGEFTFDLLVKPREFYCIARRRDDVNK